MLSLDTETTGLDFHFGTRPFFVTTASLGADGRPVNRYWEWDVDPLTREPIIPELDLQEIGNLVWGLVGDGDGEGRLVLQNGKFDITAMSTVLSSFEWPWDRTDDTLLAAHLLASNRPKDLTSLALQYLGIDIQPYEDAVEDATQKARRLCRRKAFREEYGVWAIAEEGRPDMPSASGGKKLWKADTWLPRTLWLRVPSVRAEHPEWETVLRDYANADSAVTLALWPVMAEAMQRRGLVALYRERIRLVPIAYRMESRGVSLSGTRLDELVDDYRGESERLGDVCVNLAASFGHDLEMPKGGVNANLRAFLLDVLGLPPVRGHKAKTDAPTLDKTTMTMYQETLRRGSKELAFVNALLAKRSRDTAVTYMEGYMRFWRPGREREADEFVCNCNRTCYAGMCEECRWVLPPMDYYVLHPNLNITGTDTLRWSSSSPNEQNISKKESFNLRHCFGPAPGREWWSLDAKNIELRIPAYESGEEELIALYERPDDPPYYGSNHLLNFHTIYPELWAAVEREVGVEKVGPTCKKRYAATWYQYCKNGGFAIQYGAQDREDGGGTADRAFHKRGAHALLKARFRRLEELNSRVVRFAEKYGYVETLPDRTVDPKRGYPLLCTRTEWGRIKPTVPLSYHVQGSAMWWTARAMVKVQAQLDDWRSDDGFDGHIALQVHDELVIDFPKAGDPAADAEREKEHGRCAGYSYGDSNLWRIRVVQELMSSTGDDLIPRVVTPVGCEYHDTTWSEGVSL
jgi:DNA polymerase I-like protein with 3'-5' exonuclease and polymerase domains